VRRVCSGYSSCARLNVVRWCRSWCNGPASLHFETTLWIQQSISMQPRTPMSNQQSGTSPGASRTPSVAARLSLFQSARGLPIYEQFSSRQPDSACLCRVQRTRRGVLHSFGCSFSTHMTVHGSDFDGTSCSRRGSLGTSSEISR
jgi:hypothetical protein